MNNQITFSHDTPELRKARAAVLEGLGYRGNDRVMIARKSCSGYHINIVPLGSFSRRPLKLKSLNYYISPVNHKGNGSKDSFELIGVVVDIDYGTVGHERKAVHETRDDAIAAFRNNLPMPTAIIETGGGFHLHYRLVKRLTARDHGSRFEMVSKDMSALVDATPACKINRLVRVPFTQNMKPGAPVRQVFPYEFKPNIQYRLEELEEHVNGVLV